MNRLIGFIFQSDYQITKTDVESEVLLNANYRGFCIKKIKVKADLIIESGSKVKIVQIKTGDNPYSNRARRQESLTFNSIELQTLYLAFSKFYPQKSISVEVWYMTNKDDTTSKIIERFEHKPGKNIATFSYENVSSAWKHLMNSLSFAEKGEDKCETCIHKDVCQVNFRVIKQPVNDCENRAPKTTKGVVFTKSQEKVIKHMDGPMCVIAVPGSGKTFSLTHRLATLLQKGIHPDNILFVTFTRKAANELRERVMRLMGTEDESRIPSIFTFNALGYRILKENPLLFGKRVRIADTVDRLELIKEALKESPKIIDMSYDSAYLDYGIIRTLDRMFQELEADGEENFKLRYEGKDIPGILKVYNYYSKAFKKQGFINFDMQIILVNELFSKYPSVVSKYAEKYKYIMVDEFQDTNEEQAKMIYAIAKRHNNLVVVGDDDQELYGFRGGSNKFILDYKTDFPTAKSVVMNENFRSNNAILEPANELISHNHKRLEKVIVGHKDAKYKPYYLRGTKTRDIISLINSARKNDYKLGEIAVLARSNKRLFEVADELNGIVEVAVPKDYIRNDTVFRILNDVLTLYYCGMDIDVALFRYLKFCDINVEVKSDQKLSLYTNLLAYGMPAVDKMDANCLSRIKKEKDKSPYHIAAYKLISVFKEIQYGHKIEDVLSAICDILFEEKSHKVIDHLITLADERAIVKIADLYRLMDIMILYKDDRRVGYSSRPDAVNLLTVHDSKGKEFPVVIIYATEDFENSEESNKLFYVAMTRAKNTLYFMESLHAKCELFPLFEKSVMVR